MEVVEDFESRPHKAVTFLVKRDKEFQMCRGQKMPKALPGFSGGKLPGRNKVEEEGKEAEEGEEEGQEKKMENEVIRGIISGVPKEADTVGGGLARNTVSAAVSTSVGEDSFKKSELGVGQRDDLKRINQNSKQKWDCCQFEEDFGCKGEDGRKEPTS